MKPTQELCEKVRVRLVELVGIDPGPVKLRDVFPGTDPNVTEDQLAEHIARALAQKVKGDVKASRQAPKSLRVQIDVSEFVKQFNKE